MSRITSMSDPRSEAAAPAGVAHIGCSGWHYQSWRGVVYPSDLAADRWLSAYATRFDTVELNNTFYRLPSEQTFAGWREQVSRGFVFAVKASRFLTHIKRLRDPQEPLERLLDRAQALGAALGPLLYQIPPRWFPDRERLDTFLASLPQRLAPTSRRRLHHVIEMRDPRGYEPWVIERLREHDVTLCVHDMHGSESPLLVVGPIVYVRFHGHGVKYGGSYPDAVLDEWAAWIRRAMATGRDAYVYFNNDINGFAVYDAERLRLRVEGAAARGARPPLEPDPQPTTAVSPAYPRRRARRSVRLPARRPSLDTGERP